MPSSSYPKRCSSHTDADPAGGTGAPATAKRLVRRKARLTAQVGHDYINTLSAARRHKHANKQMRLVKELKAELLEMKTLLEAMRAPPSARRGKRRRG